MMITLGRLTLRRVQPEVADSARHDQANVTVAQIVLPDRFEERLRHFRAATSESRDRSSAPNPRADPDAPPAGRRAHCKSECLQKFRRHKAGRDRRPRSSRRPRRKILRRCRSSTLWPTFREVSLSLAGFTPGLAVTVRFDCPIAVSPLPAVAVSIDTRKRSMLRYAIQAANVL